MSEWAIISYVGMSPNEVTRYVRESMPLDVGVTRGADTVVNGKERFNLIVCRMNDMVCTSRAVLYFLKTKLVTREDCGALVERYLDLYHQ